MAILPSQVQPISMDVASAYAPSNPALGATSRAIGTVGTAIAQQSLQMLEQVKKAEAIDSASTALFQDRYDSEDQMAQLKMKYPDGYVLDEAGQRKKNPDKTDRTITQEYQEWADKRSKERQSKMPSLMAQQIYNSRAGEYYSDSVQKVRNDELVLRTESFKRNMDSDLRLGLNKITDVPSVNHAYTVIQDLVDRSTSQKGVLLSEQQVYEMNKIIQKEVPQSLFDGLVNAAIAEPKDSTTRQEKVAYALSVLHGKDRDSLRRRQGGLTTISDTMDPDQKADTERRLIELGKVTEKLDQSDFNQKLSDAKSALSMGQRVNLQPMVNMGKNLLAQKRITAYEYADKIGGLVALDRALGAFSDPTFLWGSPESQQATIRAVAERSYQAFLAELPASERSQFSQVGGEQRQRITDALTRVGEESIRRLSADFVQGAQFDTAIRKHTVNLDFGNPATFYKTGGHLKERTRLLYIHGRAHFGGNSPDFRVMSKTESAQFAEFLTADTTGYQKAADGLRALYSAVGEKNYGVFIDQMIKDKNLGGEWRLAMANPKPMLITDFVKAMRDGGKIRQETEKVGKYPVGDFDTAVEKHAGQTLLGMTQAGQDSGVAAEERRRIRDVIATKAMSISYESGVTPDKAAEMASAAFLKTRYKSVAVGGSGWFGGVGSRSSLLLPSWVTPEQEKYAAENRRSILSSEQAIKALGGAPPVNAKPEQGPVFFKQVQTTGRLVLTPDQNGYYIQYLDPNGDNRNVFTEKKDRNGKPIPVVIPIEKLLEQPAAPPRPPGNFDPFWGLGGKQ